MRRSPCAAILLGYVTIIALTAGGEAAEHEFRYKASDARSVELMSDFNGWKPVPMTKGNDGVWTATVSLPAGTHAYKFVVNGTEWVFDPDNPSRTKVDGIENSAVEISDAANAVRSTATIAAQ